MTHAHAPQAATGPDALWFMNNFVSVKVSGDQNQDGISVLEQVMPFDEAPPIHVHHDEDEIFHVLSGRIRFQVGGRTRVAEAGETLCANRGVPHGFRVLSQEGARVLTITRGGFERMVRNASRPAETASLPPAEQPSPEMQAALATFCSAERIDLLGPPIA